MAAWALGLARLGPGRGAPGRAGRRLALARAECRESERRAAREHKGTHKPLYALIYYNNLNLQQQSRKSQDAPLFKGPVCRRAAVP